MAYVHNIKKYDMENSGTKGASVSIWFNHCPHHCVGCWNPETWERNEDLYRDNDRVLLIVEDGLNGPIKLNTLSLLGGDPLSPLNINDTIYILEKIKEKYPDLEIVCWTGFRWEQVLGSKALKPALEYIDILIDGRFELDKRIEGRKFGSSNQRCIDVKETLQSGEIIELGDF